MISDEQIGARVRALRGSRPQATVATSMALLGGWKTWRQQTVAQIERGDRSLKLAEAVTLTQILGCDLDALVTEED
ncbi:prophage regulatory protein [Janibacter hoylei PVAS-1]|uniref:Prophage regulatory protein n=1 Tax=Janibacter hoylei PVAS-1 TaxID=1210046 RepID=K1DWQ5_9MICO|nr:helix-turn-helix transcriptional regulator [Janibacter hoylei]EKA60754.1 prophage regulatory protein [Janibacter hoylei PVAS-1]RWU85466.1 XRE family transcriptional regulator [Janibacter hoylei PVAS-1]